MPRPRRAAARPWRIATACLAWALAAGGAARAEAPGAISVVDDAQQRVTLAQPARRIVSLSPGLTEILFAIGAGPQVVGVSAFSDTPPAARALPQVSRAQSIDLETVAALRPDLIVLWGSGYAPALREALGRLGAPVYVYEPRTLAAIARAIDDLGRLSAGADAPALATRFRRHVQDLAARYRDRPPVRVFYQVWSDPLMTINGRQVLSDVLRLCGARNVFEDLAQLAPTVDAEAVLAAQPEVIVTSEAGGVDRGALASWRRYPRLPAVAGGHLVTLDADRMDRAAPRLLDEAEVLCAAIDQARHEAAPRTPRAP